MRGEIKELLFLAPSSMLVFSSWHVRSKKINTGRGGAQLFVGIWVQHGGCPNFINQKRKHSEIRMRIWVSQDRN